MGNPPIREKIGGLDVHNADHVLGGWGKCIPYIGYRQPAPGNIHTAIISMKKLA